MSTIYLVQKIIKWLRSFVFVMVGIGMSGCSSVEYYWQAVNGHSDILNLERPISEILVEPDLDPELRKSLEQMQRARDFASKELGLPENNSYREYADIGREYVIWNVIATEEFSVIAQQWCFLFAGCVSYRGYFDKADAKEYAKKLQGRGMDVYVAGARAYSTIGWFDDPLLNTMLYRNEAMRVGVLFHELAHQQLYVQDDTAFNEAFATIVAQEGVRRWFISRSDARAYEAYLQSEKRRGEFHSLLKQAREKLQELYDHSHEAELMRSKKQAIFRQFKVDYQELKAGWDNDKRYDAWMAQPLNNAHLALVATYHEFVPAMKAYLDKADSNLPLFYQQMEQLAGLTIEERHQKLSAMMSQ